MNKDSEVFYLNKFKENFTQFPQGDIKLEERPDFLVKTKNGILGIEITEFYRERASKGQPTLQQEITARQKIINLSKSMCDHEGLYVGRVDVHFDLAFSCKKSASLSIAKKLFQLLKPCLSGETRQVIWRRDDIQINGIALMVLNYKARRRYNIWRAPLATFVPSVDSEQIQSVLDEKSIRCEGYREKCNQIWLVIIMDRFKASSFSLIPQTTLNYLYTHPFDKAFIFFYDYDEKQKPPFLLRHRL